MTEDSNTTLAAGTTTEPAAPPAVEQPSALDPVPNEPSVNPDPVPTVVEIKEIALRDALDQLRTAQMAAARDRGHILAGDGTRCQRCGAAEWAALEGAPCEPNTATP